MTNNPEVQSWHYSVLNRLSESGIEFPFQVAEDHDIETLGNQLAIVIGEDTVSSKLSARTEVCSVTFTVQIFDFTPSFYRAKTLSETLMTYLPNTIDELNGHGIQLRFQERKTKRISAPEGRAVILKYKLLITK